MSDLPFVTVGVPCLNEEGFIEALVRGALAQDYPSDRFEVMVADGGSTDRTLEILARLSKEDPRVRVLHNPGKIQAAGMNEIIKAAKGDVLVRFDAHADYAPDYVRKCIEVLIRTGADNVGGGAKTRSRSWFQRAVCAALDSPLGVGGSRYRTEGEEGFVDTVWGGTFPRRIFETIGMYDPRAVVNEDAELNQRILEAGGKIFLSKEIIAYYYPRDSFRGLAKQYFKYGKGRARTLVKHRSFPTPRPAIPFLMVATGALVLVAPPLQLLAPLYFGSYGLLTAVEAVRVGRKAGLSAIPAVWAIFPVLHVAHGAGFGAGLLHFLRSPDWTEPERLAPRDPASKES
jgi:glycosyltransferase involved in cell wall biosynthesis